MQRIGCSKDTKRQAVRCIAISLLSLCMLVGALPFVASAQYDDGFGVANMVPTASDGPAQRTIPGIIGYFMNFLGYLAPFIIALTVLVFLWGVFRLVLSTEDASKKQARGVMVFGVIALFVMVSVWGLVNLLVYSFGLQNSSDAPQGPGVPRFN